MAVNEFSGQYIDNTEHSLKHSLPNDCNVSGKIRSNNFEQL